MSSPQIARSGDLLLFTAEGEYSLDRITDAMSMALRRAIADRCPLLLDVRRGRIPTFSYRDAYAIVDALAAMSPPPSLRIAVLDQYDEAFVMTQFFEAAGSVRGLALHSFIDEETARRWLRSAA